MGGWVGEMFELPQSCDLLRGPVVGDDACV